MDIRKKPSSILSACSAVEEYCSSQVPPEADDLIYDEDDGRPQHEGVELWRLGDPRQAVHQVQQVQQDVQLCQAGPLLPQQTTPTHAAKLGLRQSGPALQQ
jgi:hypothetical protein